MVIVYDAHLISESSAVKFCLITVLHCPYIQILAMKNHRDGFVTSMLVDALQIFDEPATRPAANKHNDRLCICMVSRRCVILYGCGVLMTGKRPFCSICTGMVFLGCEYACGIGDCFWSWIHDGTVCISGAPGPRFPLRLGQIYIDYHQLLKQEKNI